MQKLTHSFPSPAFWSCVRTHVRGKLPCCRGKFCVESAGKEKHTRTHSQPHASSREYKNAGKMCVYFMCITFNKFVHQQHAFYGPILLEPGSPSLRFAMGRFCRLPFVAIVSPMTCVCVSEGGLFVLFLLLLFRSLYRDDTREVEIEVEAFERSSCWLLIFAFEMICK